MNLLTGTSYFQEWASNKKCLTESECATVKDRRNLLLIVNIVNRACVSMQSSVLGILRISFEKKMHSLFSV